jgi:HAD superfamily hydrolase (TIGR01509 family)
MERRMELNIHTRLYPNVIPILEALSGRYQLGVITNTQKDMTIKILNHFNIYGYFDVVVSGDEGRPKPAPDLILKACKIICVQPEASYFVGDTMADVQAGKAAGCKTIILSTSIQRETLVEFDDILVIDDLIEILKII